MSIEIEPEPFEVGPPGECCCFCTAVTNYWSVVQDVPVCPACAERYAEKDVPTKDRWYEREHHRAKLEELEPPANMMDSH